MLQRLLLALTLSALGGSAIAAELQFGLAKAKFEERPWTTTEHRKFMREYGADDFAAVFWNLLSPDNLAHPFDWVRDNYLENGCVPVVVTLLPNGANEDSIAKSELSEGDQRAIGNHDDILAGEYDEAIEAFAVRLKRAVERSGCPDYRPTINHMHEADGSWYAWGMDAVGNSAESYAAAYRHIVEIFQRVNAPVDFQLNLNRRDGEGEVMRLIDEWFPLLDPVVDRYAISSYNRCGTMNEATEYRSFWSEFGPAYRKLAERTNKPIDVAEVSTSTLCRDMETKLVWFEEMLASIELYAPQTDRVTFFFGDIAVGEASNEVVINWGFPPEYRGDFRAILKRFEEATVRPAEPAAPERRTKTTIAPTSTPKPAAPAVLRTDSEPRFPNRSPANENESGDTVLGFDRMPWSAWGRFTLPLAEQGNPALNPVTGNSFGETGPLFRWTLSQRGLWDEGNFEHGPGIRFGGVHSRNRDQWWNNSVDLGATYGLYWDAPRNGAIKWGGWSVELFAGRRQYLAPVPDRFDGGGEWRVELQLLGYNFGGDWLR